MSKIHEFDPQIYPFKLWVAITPDFYEVFAKFLDLDTRQPFELINSNNMGAVTLPVFKYGSAGVLIVFCKKDYITTGNIAHEASHYAKIVFRYIGADMTYHEPYEYLVGWAANCIEKAKKYKTKKK